MTPIQLTDSPVIEDLIFSDPEVAKGLAHDISTAEGRRWSAERWCSEGLESGLPAWTQFGMGRYVVRDRIGAIASPGEILGMAGLKLIEADATWSGELVYALGRPYHRQRVASESVGSLVSRFFSHPAAGELSALFWHLLNPGSERILKSVGFKPAGFVNAIDEFGKTRIEGIRRFEVWRLAHAGASDAPRVAEEVGVKLGHFVREGISTIDESVSDIQAALSSKVDRRPIRKTIENAVERGSHHVGFALYRRSN